MRFSTTASFTAGVVLAVIGVAALKKTLHKSQFLFASIPIFFFGVQQLAEVILRGSLQNHNSVNTQKLEKITEHITDAKLNLTEISTKNAQLKCSKSITTI